MSIETGFSCTTSAECQLGGVQGVCERVGVCSFPDPSCSSMRRYGQYSGSLGGTCVPTSAPGGAGGASGTGGTGGGAGSDAAVDATPPSDAVPPDAPTDATAPDAPPPVSTTLIAAVSRLCVDVANGSPAPGVGIEQDPCDGSPAQTFSFVPMGNAYRILTGTGLSLCLDYSGTSSSVIQAFCGNSSDQGWTYTRDPGGSVTIHTGNGLACLGVQGGSTQAHATIDVEPCTSAFGQRFIASGL
jgi:hypothetical protein